MYVADVKNLTANFPTRFPGDFGIWNRDPTMTGRPITLLSSPPVIYFVGKVVTDFPVPEAITGMDFNISFMGNAKAIFLDICFVCEFP